jgi:hypothetical protein
MAQKNGRTMPSEKQGMLNDFLSDKGSSRLGGLRFNPTQKGMQQS